MAPKFLRHHVAGDITWESGTSTDRVVRNVIAALKFRLKFIAMFARNYTKVYKFANFAGLYFTTFYNN